MASVIEAFRDLFRGEEKFTTHSTLFAIAGISGVLQLMSQTYTSQFETLDTTAMGTSSLMNTIGIVLGFFVISCLLSIYLQGFCTVYINRKWRGELGLPEFNGSMWGVGFKYFVLLLYWGILFAIAGGLAGLLCIIPVLGVIAMIAALIILIPYAFGLNFVQVKFAKEFDFAGLFSPALLFNFGRLTIWSVILTWLKLVGIAILMFLILAIIAGIGGVVVSLLGGMAKEFGEVIGAIMGGYIGALLGLIWAHCMFEIYLDKIDPEMPDDDYDIG